MTTAVTIMLLATVTVAAVGWHGRSLVLRNRSQNGLARGIGPARNPIWTVMRRVFEMARGLRWLPRIEAGRQVFAIKSVLQCPLLTPKADIAAADGGEQIRAAAGRMIRVISF